MSLERNLERIRGEIAAACARAGRDPDTVTLVAAGKTVAPGRLAAAAALGVRDIGENDVRELLAKREAISGVTWHYLGRLQSNTAPRVAGAADVVHSFVPGRAVLRLARRAAELGRSVRVLIQVDFAGRGTATPPDAASSFADQAAAMDGVVLAGFMTIPPPEAAGEASRPFFARLRALRDLVRERHPEAAELSMGMSSDFAVAVEEGATMVRVGTGLFGDRPIPGAARDA